MWYDHDAAIYYLFFDCYIAVIALVLAFELTPVDAVLPELITTCRSFKLVRHEK